MNHVDDHPRQALISVRDLEVDIASPQGTVRAVRGISFDVAHGETLCLVGESGCGKSMTSLALMGLLPRNAQRRARHLRFDGRDMQDMSESQVSAMRGNDVAMIFQEPMTSLNPSLTVGRQLLEGYVRHGKGTRAQARERAIYLMEKVCIPSPEARLRQFPHQLSGGLRQRVMIAMALMCSPKLIIADEPTTALDVTVQAQTLALLKDLQSEFGMTILLITHDLGVVARVADQVAIMYAGEIVESGPALTVFQHARHPYTQGLLDCIPIPGKVKPGEHLGYIPGQVPSLLGASEGCAFRNRCRFAMAQCGLPVPLMQTDDGAHRYRCVLAPDLAAAEALA